MSRIFRISQISMPPGHTKDQVFTEARRIAGVKAEDLLQIGIAKQSVDARKKDAVIYSYAVDIRVKPGIRVRKSRRISVSDPVLYCPAVSGREKLRHPIAVIGAGPAGLFCAYLLARSGFRPVVYERGKEISARQKDVEKFWKTGFLDPASNVLFGEGGAGTFSDGKLNTLVKDKYGRNRFVLETFVRFGAPEEILYVGKPHIGTDLLVRVITNMREEIFRLGGSIRFGSQITDLEISDRRLTAIQINDKTWDSVSAAVLAVGHSARDTFFMLSERRIPMEAKPFAVGLRAEHPQSMINENQYGASAEGGGLPAASYKLTHRAGNGRSVYTFCMCPGGYVVNASSESGMLAVNGMSYHRRDAANANSAVIVSVTPEDFGCTGDPLAGIAFQRRIEREAFQLAQGKIPQQLFGDFEADRKSGGYGEFSSCVKGAASFANLRHLLPEPVCEAFLEGMHAFGGRISGFDRADCILSGVESRTSSPVRILRNETFESAIQGLYPCGEGAGYAGGIMSAAMDGLKTAEALMKKYTPADFAGIEE